MSSATCAAVHTRRRLSCPRAQLSPAPATNTSLRDIAKSRRLSFAGHCCRRRVCVCRAAGLGARSAGAVARALVMFLCVHRGILQDCRVVHTAEVLVADTELFSQLSSCPSRPGNFQDTGRRDSIVACAAAVSNRLDMLGSSNDPGELGHLSPLCPQSCRGVPWSAPGRGAQGLQETLNS